MLLVITRVAVTGPVLVAREVAVVSIMFYSTGNRKVQIFISGPPAGRDGLLQE